MAVLYIPLGGGNAKVGGTNYQVGSGKTKVNNTNYDIVFDDDPFKSSPAIYSTNSNLQLTPVYVNGKYYGNGISSDRYGYYYTSTSLNGSWTYRAAFSGTAESTSMWSTANNYIFGVCDIDTSNNNYGADFVYANASAAPDTLSVNTKNIMNGRLLGSYPVDVLYNNSRYFFPVRVKTTASSSSQLLRIVCTNLSANVVTNATVDCVRATDVKFGNGKYVCVGQVDRSNYVAFTLSAGSEGSTFTQTSIPTLSSSWSSVGLGHLAFLNGKFYCFHGLNRYAYSTDGVNWTTATTSLDGSDDASVLVQQCGDRVVYKFTKNISDVNYWMIYTTKDFSTFEPGAKYEVGTYSGNGDFLFQEDNVSWYILEKVPGAKTTAHRIVRFMKP